MVRHMPTFQKVLEEAVIPVDDLDGHLEGVPQPYLGDLTNHGYSSLPAWDGSFKWGGICRWIKL